MEQLGTNQIIEIIMDGSDGSNNKKASLDKNSDHHKRETMLVADNHELEMNTIIVGSGRLQGESRASADDDSMIRNNSGKLVATSSSFDMEGGVLAIGGDGGHNRDDDNRNPELEIERGGDHDGKQQQQLQQQQQQQPGWRRFLAHIGPGFLICMAYIDPGSVQTLFNMASKDKYQLLWIIIAGFVLVYIVQTLAANLGVVTGLHLAEHCRLEYPKYVNYILWIMAEVAVIGADIAEVIGTAYALNMLFQVPIWVGVVVSGFTPFILIVVQRYGVDKLETMLALIVFVIAICFCGELPFIKPKATDVLEGFIPRFNGNSAVGDGIAFLGALIMPHNLFIHSALVLTRRPPPSVKGLNEACKFFAIESLPPLALALFISIVAVVVAASICYSPTISSDAAAACSNLTLDNATVLFKDILGRWSNIVYGIALLASAQGSSITVNYSGQFVMQGFLELKIKKWVISISTRMFAMIPSLVIAIVGGSSGCGQLIIISSIVLSFELPYTILPLLRFTSTKIKMGPHVNNVILSVVAWILGLGVIGINVYYMITGYIDWLLHNKQPKYVPVLVSIIVFPLLAAYLGGMIYLGIKKSTATTYEPPPPLQSSPTMLNKEPRDGSADSEEIPYREDLADLVDSD